MIDVLHSGAGLGRPQHNKGGGTMRELEEWGVEYQEARLLAQASFADTTKSEAWMERLWLLWDGSLELQCWGGAFSRHASLDGREHEMLYAYTEEEATDWAWRRSRDGLLDFLVLRGHKYFAFGDDGRGMLLLDEARHPYFLSWEDCAITELADDDLAHYIAQFGHTSWTMYQERFNEFLDAQGKMKINEWA